jgi:hypothetical protein
MGRLSRSDLMNLEDYAEAREGFRREVIEHKKHRRIPLGDHVTLYFEDRMTIQYQIQEMLRTEKIFEKAGIEEELEAYNPLIPDGTNWKATFMIEYPDVDQRREALAKLIGIEDRVWVRVGEGERIFAIADEDLERETEEKTSAVHFLRFELDPDSADRARNGAAIHVGVDLPNYTVEMGAIPEPSRQSLAADLG